VGSRAGTVRGTIHRIIVQYDQYVVAAELDVELRHDKAMVVAAAQAGKRVFRGDAAAAAMRDNGGVRPGSRGFRRQAGTSGCEMRETAGIVACRRAQCTPQPHAGQLRELTPKFYFK